MGHSNCYSECRYGDIAAKIVGDRPVVLDRSENDYQGTVYVEAGDDRGYVVIEYSYGPGRMPRFVLRASA